MKDSEFIDLSKRKYTEFAFVMRLGRSRNLNYSAKCMSIHNLQTEENKLCFLRSAYIIVLVLGPPQITI